MLAEIRKQLYVLLAALRRVYLRSVWGMSIGKGARISGKAHLDFTNPKGIHIGDHTIITPGVRIFTHDYVGAYHDDTKIGKCCFVGAGSIITNAVHIGDHCIIAAGSVVTSDVPSGSMVAGNPARIVKEGIVTGHYGRRVSWAQGRNDQNEEISDSAKPSEGLNGPQHSSNSD